MTKYIITKGMNGGANGANASIREQEKHIILMLEQSKKFFSEWSSDCDQALDYYRLREGGTYDDEEVKRIDKSGRKIMQDIPTIKQSKHYMYEKTRSNMLDTLGYMYHDFFVSNPHNIFPMDKEELKQFLDENEVDTY